MAFKLVTAAVTLSGSLLSSIASFCVLVCFLFIRKSQRTFRHALVFNLTLADFINATNNSVSGIIYIRTKALQPGPACNFNGWLGQLSVQATDFSVLAISVVMLLVVTQTDRITEASTLKKTAMCLSTWIVPIITSSIALGLGEISPVSGNWCWISPKRTDLRYALGHGWRFAIIITTICIYTYVWIFITRHFRKFGSTALASDATSSTTQMPHLPAGAQKRRPNKRLSFFSAIQKEITSSLAAGTAGGRGGGGGGGRSPRGSSRFRMATLVEAEDDSSSIAASQENLLRVQGPENGASSAQKPMITTTTTLTITSADQRPRSSHSDLASERHGDPRQEQQQQPQQSTQHAATDHSPLSPPAASASARAATAAAATTTTTVRITADEPNDCSSNSDSNSDSKSKIMQNGQTNQFRANSRRVEREIKKMLLLNGYPIAYVVLWLPGILNRVLEASDAAVPGDRAHVLAVLQASTQFIGFANAVTYALSRQWQRG